MGFLSILLVLTIFIILLYPAISYINYRIVRKFDATTTYLDNLIPFWNIYLIDRVAFGKPYAVYYFWGCFIVNIVLNEVTKNYFHDSVIMAATTCIYALIFATPMSLIAQKLGKNLWLFFLLLIIPSQINLILAIIITVILQLILAFDGSKPIPLPDSDISNNNAV